MDYTKKTKNSFRQTADSLNQWSHVFSAGVASGNHFRVFWKRWFPELGNFFTIFGGRERRDELRGRSIWCHNSPDR